MWKFPLIFLIVIGITNAALSCQLKLATETSGTAVRIMDDSVLELAKIG